MMDRPPSGHWLSDAELAFLREARMGHLATVNAAGWPSVVPFCFALLDRDEPIMVSVVDEKPKRVADTRLARVRNIEANPAVSVVVDRYDEDWVRLAFVQVRGKASLVAPGADVHAEAVTALQAKYPQYRSMAIDERPLIVIEDLRASSWRGDGDPFG